MISLPEFKKLLGPLADTVTDAEIEVLRSLEYQLADAFIAWWLHKQRKEIIRDRYAAAPIGNVRPEG